jgi:hypothetical protein
VAQSRLSVKIGIEYLEKNGIQFEQNSHLLVIVGEHNPMFLTFFQSRVGAQGYFRDIGFPKPGLLIMCNQSCPLTWKNISHFNELAINFDEFESVETLPKFLRTL